MRKLSKALQEEWDLELRYYRFMNVGAIKGKRIIQINFNKIDPKLAYELFANKIPGIEVLGDPFCMFPKEILKEHDYEAYKQKYWYQDVEVDSSIKATP